MTSLAPLIRANLNVYTHSQAAPIHEATLRTMDTSPSLHQPILPDHSHIPNA